MTIENNYTVTCNSWSELPDSITKLSDLVTNNVIPNQNASKKGWEIIRIEIWEDTGRFIAFPANRIFKYRIDVSAAQIICAEIQKDIEVINYSKLPDNVLDQKTEKLVMKMANILKTNIPKNISYDYEIYNQDGYKIGI